MPFKKIAVIGAGPKAAALSAKAEALNSIKDTDIRITVFEKSTPGAHWDGKHGYTDGLQELCTPAERDVGFPYASTFDPAVACRMQERYSWQAFKVSDSSYAAWLNKGRRRPTHRDFSRYLTFCFGRAAAPVIVGEVRELRIRGKKWEVVYVDRRGEAHAKRDFDAVVVTGSGPANQLRDAVADARYFDGVSFWQSLDKMPSLCKETDNPIVIIGAGGTAAAIAGWFTHSGIYNDIYIVGSQAAMFARVDNAFENELFTDPGAWGTLSRTDRREFTNRLTRGAVWSNVLDQLSRAGNVRYYAGNALRVRVDSGGNLVVDYKTSASASEKSDAVSFLSGAVVINTTGFDALWFRALLPQSLRASVVSPEQVQNELQGDLQLPLHGAPPLHLPMLSHVVSPAFTSLMALGDMADTILAPYVAST